MGKKTSIQLEKIINKREAIIIVASFLFLFIANTCYSQRREKESDIVWGMLVIGDSVLVDDTEITIAEYMEFVLDGTGNINKSRLPTEDSIISKYFLGNEPKEFVEIIGLTKYIKVAVNLSQAFPKEVKFYTNIPVSNISYSQALEFCKWRTTQDSLYAYSNGLKQRYIFELPSVKFYDLVLHPKDSIKAKTSLSNFNYKNANYLIQKKERINEQRLCGKSRLPVASFYSNDLSLYDLQGNVAEMTSSAGIAKGGSFNNYAIETYQAKQLSYSEAADWLGFRCIARKVEIK